MNTPIRALMILMTLLTVVALSGAVTLAEDEKPEEPEKPKEPEKAELGEKAPDFTLIDSTGKERKLSDYEDKIVVLEWTNAECQFVQRHYRLKLMPKTYEKVKELDKDIVWLAINSTANVTNKQMEFWIEEHDLKYPILMDGRGDVGHLYEARRTPEMFVIDAEGILRYHGAIDNDPHGKETKETRKNYVVNAVQQLLDEEDVTPDETKPYGCSVKYARKSRGGRDRR